MHKTASVRLNIDEIVLLRRALSISTEDGSLYGEDDPVTEERRYRVEDKLVDALRKIKGE